ncbi:MAG: outer membrane lipoprotein carrier protein LolA [Bacteroidaceae bacterium]|nr:outer membrane lipoprotein carrier protein LolA [Bacteroidaceae bacterium]
MKALVFSVILNLCTVYALAQSGTENAIDEISKASQTVNTLQCDFVQTKKLKMLNDAMVSKGKMWCSQPDRLRWEYLEPYSSAFILNKGKLLLKKGKRSNVISVNRSKMLKEMTRIMIPPALGKCLMDKKDFFVSVETKDNIHILELLPLSKELKQMYTKIILYYDRRQSIVTKVEMREKNGDNTTIELTSIKKNMAINESVYALKE